MKYLFTIFLATFYTGVFAQELKENDKDSKSGLVYFIRGNQNESYRSAFSALIDGDVVCNLDIQTYSVHEVLPGTHEFDAQFEGESEKNKAAIIKMDVEAGKTYYFKVVTQVTFLIKDVVVKELTSKAASDMVKNEKIVSETNCSK